MFYEQGVDDTAIFQVSVFLKHVEFSLRNLMEIQSHFQYSYSVYRKIYSRQKKKSFMILRKIYLIIEGISCYRSD